MLIINYLTVFAVESLLINIQNIKNQIYNVDGGILIKNSKSFLTFN